MRIQQALVGWICGLLCLQQIAAVVNNGQKIAAPLNINATVDIVDGGSNTSDNNTRTNVSGVTDSVAESSEHEANRREAPHVLSDSYGTPISSNSYPIQNSYSPPPSSNIGLPVPIYGVPSAPSNNIIYPGPPPDIPPPPHKGGSIDAPHSNYGAPSLRFPPPKYGPPLLPNRPLKPFNPPHFSARKPIYGPPTFIGHPPRPLYGAPLKPHYNHQKLPKPAYGPPFKLPKPHYGPPKSLYGPPKPTYGVPTGFVNIPKDIYGPPKNIYAPSHATYGPPPAIKYGPPQPVPHGPPHPGAPAPPTPPDIKYDGWQPIPGLVSRPPPGSFNVLKGQSHALNDLHFNSDFIPPASGGDGFGLAASYKGTSGFSDSYGAPLNTVTGSGGTIHTSGDAHSEITGVSSLFGDHHQNALSLVKSIGYEILPNANKITTTGDFGGGNLLGDSYSSPPLNSFSPNGPYAAAHAYKQNDFSQLGNFGSSFNSALLGNSHEFGRDYSAGIGLIPPSGLYGVPPSGKYGTPLLHPPNKYKGHGFKPPKQPVKFRDPVPAGLIESIGNLVVHKDASGIVDNAYSNSFGGTAYIPPPVPDVGKPGIDQPPNPSALYSLPTKNAISFQNVAHGSPNAELNHNFGAAFNFNGASSAALTSYNVPFGTVESSYGLPHVGGLENFGTAQAATNNYVSAIAGSYATPTVAYQTIGHDCSQKSQSVPSLSFGVPSANSYSASLASLNTNIAGAYQGPPPSITYGVSDLQSAHSQSSGILSDSSSNSLEQDQHQAEVTGKSLANTFGSDTELIKSQSIDFNNIPIQGALGSYTLQIQSADGGGGGVTGIPHEQVLNNELLQSILSAIEQPKQNPATILGQPLLHLQQIPPQPLSDNQFNRIQVIPSGSGQFYDTVPDSEAQNSVIKNIVVTPSPLQDNTAILRESKSATDVQETGRDLTLPLIDNNEIALYFNNNVESTSVKNSNEENVEQSKKDVLAAENVGSGQQYGSYVSFKTPDSSYVYGDFKPSNLTVQSDLKGEGMT